MTKSSHTLHIAVAAALLTTTALAAAVPAAAQDATAPEPEYSTDIIVTATLRSESLQDVPISIQALGEEMLQEQSVASFDDYARLLPSVSYQSFGPGQSQLNFRGITSGGDGLDAGSLPPPASMSTNVPVTTIGFAVDLHVYDVSRVEALSSPQGTLFGASSLSGTLRVITNEPDPSGLEGRNRPPAQQVRRRRDGGQAEGFLNIPISPDAALRVVG